MTCKGRSVEVVFYLDAVVTQIRERAEWLAEMEYLGEGAKHREIINEQIAERMRAMDALGIDSQCPTTR